MCIILVGTYQSQIALQFMAIRFVEFSFGGTKLERFLPKNHYTRRKLLNFENWVNGVVSKIGHHFRKKSDLIIEVINYVNNKKCAPKLVFFNKKN